MISFQIQHLKPENIPKAPYNLSTAPNDITTAATEPPSSAAPAPSSSKGKQPLTSKAAAAPVPQTPTSKSSSRQKAQGTEQSEQKPAHRPLPAPPTPYPPLGNRISQYSPALSTGLLIDTVKAGMNAAAEGPLPGMPGLPAGNSKGKRKVVRVRG
jgi:signal recognition particle subunit SRP19